ncbi:MAG: fluoride efflux transporter CrcB [Flavobacteriales bacterium]|nr:fluoride efflux transporter CrcB [Flavobacteriales bacterium]
MNFIYVALGGALGAVSRFGVSELVKNQTTSGFPTATLLANLIGCLLIGVLWKLLAENEMLNLLLIVGFLGGFTTFSSFGLDGYKLITNGNWSSFASYFLISNIGGLLLVFVGTRAVEMFYK